MTLFLEKPQRKDFFKSQNLNHQVYDQTSKRVKKWKEEHPAARHDGHRLPLELKPTQGCTHPGGSSTEHISSDQAARKLMLMLSLAIIISIPQRLSRQLGKVREAEAVIQGLYGAAEEAVHFG